MKQRRNLFRAIFSGDADRRSELATKLDSDALSAFKTKLEQAGRLPDRSSGQA